MVVKIFSGWVIFDKGGRVYFSKSFATNVSQCHATDRIHFNKISFAVENTHASLLVI